MEQQFVFTSPLSYFEVKEKGKKRFFLKGVFSSTDKDLVNDICTMNCLESMVEQFQAKSIKLDFEHEALRGDTHEDSEINKTRMPVGKAISAEIDGDTAIATWELNEGYKKFDSKGNVVLAFKDIKEGVQNGMFDAFSIGFIPTQISQKNIDGESIRMIDDVRLINVALTGNPVNTAAQMQQVFMKSMDAVQEYKNDKLTNPELAEKLEIKARHKKKRNTGHDDEDEEDMKRGKKKQKKAYEKDGAHAHTEEAPLGLHDHPEIERIINANFQFLNDKINHLAEHTLGEVEGKALMETKPIPGFSSFTACVAAQRKKGNSEDSANKICGSLQAQSEGKVLSTTSGTVNSSNKPGDTNYQKEVNKVTDNNTTNESVENEAPAEQAESEAKDEESSKEESAPEASESEAPAAASESENEVKALREDVARLTKTVKGLQETATAPSRSANSKAVQEPADTKSATAQGSAGLSELS